MIEKTENNSNFIAVTQEETANKVIEVDSSMVFTVKDGVVHCSIDGQEKDIVKAIFNFIIADPRVESLLEKGKLLANNYRDHASKLN